MNRKNRPKMVFILLALALASAVYLFNMPDHSSAQESDPLSDPVVLGAWLYEGNCVRCHGEYGDERVGQGFEQEVIIDKIAGDDIDSCNVTWGYSNGGPLKSSEIKAIAQYILAWEELGSKPDLPPLPAQPTETPFPTATPSEGGEVLVEESSPTPTEALDPQLQTILDGSTLAKGAYLYTQQCHRCHLSYKEGRMGYGVDPDDVKDYIVSGKVGTSMPAFSRDLGGELKLSEINAILEYIVAYESLNGPPALPDILFIAPTPDPTLLEMAPLPQATTISGDLQNGARLYTLHCVECHGPKGEGLIGAKLAKTWYAVRPDLTIKSTIVNGIPGSIMPAWSKSNEGLLNEEEINDLVVLILDWSEDDSARGKETPLSEQTTNLPQLLVGLTSGMFLLGVAGIVIQMRNQQKK